MATKVIMAMSSKRLSSGSGSVSTRFHLLGVGDGIESSFVLELDDSLVEGVSKGFDAGGAQVPIVGSGSEVIGPWRGMLIVGSL